MLKRMSLLAGTRGLARQRSSTTFRSFAVSQECFDDGAVRLSHLFAGDVVSFCSAAAFCTRKRGETSDLRARSFLRYVRYRGETSWTLLLLYHRANWSMSSFPSDYDDQVRQLLTSINRRPRLDAVTTPYYSCWPLGLRSGEVASLELGDID